MPTGTPYNSFIAPYRIRVDDFCSLSNEATPLLHLLTHTHSDHINGLSAKSFGYNVICSHDAKEMLLNHQVQAERELDNQELRAEKKRTYSHLKIERMVTQMGDSTIMGQEIFWFVYSRSIVRIYLHVELQLVVFASQHSDPVRTGR